MEKEAARGHLLVIDDEENILRLFQRDFHHTGIEIHSAKNFEEAAEILSSRYMDIVISDLKMQGVDGIECLKRIKTDYPDVHRILISGIIEKPEVIKAITNGTASAFIAKPWDRNMLLNRVDHILENRMKLRQKHLVETIRKIDALPALPRIYLEFMEAYNNDASIKDIAYLLHQDVSLTTEVLRIANSAYYGSVEISDLKQGILHLGLKYVKDIVFTVSVINQMKWDSRQLDELHIIFDHSIRVNRYLGQYFKLKYEENLNNNFSSAGVIHDIGKIIQLQYFPDLYYKIRAHLRENPHLDWFGAENELGMNGSTHTEIGAFFLDHWNFPEMNIEMVLHHHAPHNSSDYLSKFMYGLRYINEFVTYYDRGMLNSLANLKDFPYDDLSPEELEQLYFSMLEP